MTPWVHRLMFDPPWWGVFLNPHFLPRRALSSAMREHGAKLHGRVLDVGCGMQPYRSFLSLSNAVVGLEIDTPENRASAKLADVFYDGVEIPFPPGAFDGVLCNQVLEHAIEPAALLREIARVLTTRGTLILSVPFLWPEHEQPNDNQRFTTFGLGHALAEAGLEVQLHLRLVPSGAAICALFADHVNGTVRSWWLPARLAVRATVIATANIVGCLLSRFTTKEAALFLDNFVVARKLETAGAR